LSGETVKRISADGSERGGGGAGEILRQISILA
jgi:hypothetical protein